ncbi:MAG: hypothetical protein KJO08_09215, partial [Gammaproteobacteria bacterium]|nr:hypothetical protein [Gammaproteobacteria bacterium]
LALKAKGEQNFTCKFGDYDLQKLFGHIPEGMVQTTQVGWLGSSASGASPQQHGSTRGSLRSTPGTQNTREEKPAGSSRWEKTMIALSGLGGFAAIVALIIGGGGIIGWFTKPSPPDEPFPLTDSLVTAPVVIGSVMIAGGLVAWWWRRRNRSG